MASLNRRRPKSPEEQARSLLLRHLTEEQAKTYRKDGFFHFTDRKGNRWRLQTFKTAMRMQTAGLQSSLQGRLISFQPRDQHLGWSTVFNIWTEDMGNIPEDDEILAIKLFVETGQEPENVACSGRYYATS